VPADLTRVLFAQVASGHWFIEALGSNRDLEPLKGFLGAEITTVFENVRSWITIRIVYAVIHKKVSEAQPYFFLMAAHFCAAEAP